MKWDATPYFVTEDGTTVTGETGHYTQYPYNN